MRNLQYEILICQKSHNTVTIAVYVWTMVQILMKQMLVSSDVTLKPLNQLSGTSFSQYS